MNFEELTSRTIQLLNDTNKAYNDKIIEPEIHRVILWYSNRMLKVIWAPYITKMREEAKTIAEEVTQNLGKVK